MPTSVTMPITIVMPIIAVMFSSMPVSHRPMNTAETDSSEVATIAIATEKRS